MLRLAALLLAVLAPLAGAAAPAPASKPVTLLAAGDIAVCGYDADERTAELLDGLRGTILALGDTVYDDGTDEEYARCYAPSWGRHLARTRTVVGNHEYRTPGAAGYFRYFGARAGPRREGYYSFRHGSWLVVVLNSNCAEAGGCGASSPQGRWLRRVLARSPRCTLAATHHPRYTSGLHGDDASMGAFWTMLARARAEILLSGHDHHYERFAQRGGVRQFVVGTGGAYLRPMLLRRGSHSQARQWHAHGVLELTLRPDRYSWRFRPVAGASYRDAGSTRCR